MFIPSHFLELPLQISYICSKNDFHNYLNMRAYVNPIAVPSFSLHIENI
jgi:hypothetical protein